MKSDKTFNVKEGKGLVYVDKPAGISTHAVDAGKPGYCEFLSRRLGQKLLVIHRLDKTTSGAMAFATHAERAEEIRRFFVEKKVRKNYWFVTDRHVEAGELSAASLIEKQGSHFVSSPQGAHNAVTHFTRVKRSPFLELWSAMPESGKPHQIRLHARDVGLPILGDPLYGGTPYPRLCLHARTLQFPDEGEWLAPPPRIFERLGLARDLEVAKMLGAMDFRERVFHFLGSPERTLRLIDHEVEGLTADLFGDVLWISWFRPTPPDQRWMERFALIGRVVGKKILLQLRPDRGQKPGPAEQFEIEAIPDKWIAHENNLQYEFRKKSGESSGLFLDQRLNRKKLASLSSGKSILNLFSYTGGFGLAALKSGASHVTCVDLNKSVIHWGQENRKLNRLTSSAEDFATDVLFFLERAVHKNRKWDLIICDPPIFGRSQDKVFRIEKDWVRLLDLCRKVLAPKGTIFFSTHYGAWTQESLRHEIHRRFAGVQITDGETDWDFSPQHSLKSFWIQF